MKYVAQFIDKDLSYYCINTMKTICNKCLHGCTTRIYLNEIIQTCKVPFFNEQKLAAYKEFKLIFHDSKTLIYEEI